MEALWSFLLILSSTILPLSASVDTIRSTKPLTRYENLTSANQNFALGFFTPKNSTKIYLGIWYYNIPTQTVIWVANRDSPLPNNSKPELTVGDDGNLLLWSGAKQVIWSSNVTAGSDMSANSTVGLLQDNGNFVLKNGESDIKWQSFDYLTDTLIPEMKLGFKRTTGRGSGLTSWAEEDDPRPGLYSMVLDPNSNVFQINFLKGGEMYFRGNVYSNTTLYTGKYHKHEGAMYLEYVMECDEKYIHFKLSQDYSKVRFRATPSGKLQYILWERNAWRIKWQFPETRCAFYGKCGPNSSCERNESLPLCKCLTGFQPKFQKGWNSGNWAGGCVRIKALTCDPRDRFQKHQQVKRPDHAISLGNMTADKCQTHCVKNCLCTAYAYGTLDRTPQVNCLNWFGELVDIQENYPYDDPQELYVRHDRSETVASFGNGHRKRDVTLITTAVFTGLLLIVFSSYIWRRKSLKRIKRMHINANGMVQSETEILSLSLLSVLAATDSFSEENKLGEGGFGPVYKGWMQEFGEVAIKRLSKRSSQGLEEFMNEVKLISKLQHKNLVTLLGWCVEGDEKILIYEYLTHSYLIIKGIAQGLLYLHKYSRLRVIHRDLKASNILLNESMTPKVSDFGMARIFGIDQTDAKTQRVVGTYGYMSPEYVIHGQFSEKSDVFSFGVLLLEIVSGKRNKDFLHREPPLTLLEWAWKNWIEGRVSNSIDPSIKEACNHHEAMKCINIGLLCVQERPSERPIMSEVMLMLCNENASIKSPREPGFTTRTSSETTAQASNNEVTITHLEPR